jgi:hypothetical protein
MNLLDRRLSRLRRKHRLPDLPEVRKMMRLAWLNGFTFGACERQVAAAREEGLQALRRYAARQCLACSELDYGPCTCTRPCDSICCTGGF